MIRLSPVSKNRKKRGKSLLSRILLDKMAINYICLRCEGQEKIPYDAVRSFELMDANGAEPPQFVCGVCGGTMYPEYYKGVQGNEYRIENARDKANEH